MGEITPWGVCGATCARGIPVLVGGGGGENSRVDSKLRNLATALSLSPRETEVFVCRTLGGTRQDVSDLLGCSVSSVDTYTRRISRKAARAGLVSREGIGFGEIGRAALLALLEKRE